MLNRALSILLTAMLAACPCFCKGGGTSHADEHTELHAHCGCCHAEIPFHAHDEESSSSDSDHDSAPCSDRCGGQCICNGAVVEDAIALDLNLDAGWWAAVVLPQLHIVQVADSNGITRQSAHPPDNGANLGRTLCCLYQTFLC
jgi:hypothetical protein